MNKDDWLPMLHEKFAACKTPQEIMQQSRLLWDLRSFDGIVEHGFDAWKYAARKLDVVPRKVVVVDLPGIASAAHYIAKKEDGNTPEMVMHTLRKLYKELSPEVFLVATDCRTPTKRSMLYPAYKSDRESDEERREDVAKAIEEVRNSKAFLIECDGYEADDVMATAAFICQLSGSTCTLVTEDKDLWQCLGKGTAIYSNRKKEFFGADWLRSEHKIRPTQVVDWLCLVGKDAAPTIHGVSDKTASEWLEAYGDFIGITNHLKDLSPKKRELITAYQNDYWIAKELHTLSRGVDGVWW